MVRSNVTRDSAQVDLIPGELANDLPGVGHLTPSQRAEHGYYLPCSVCGRLNHEIMLDGCDRTGCVSPSPDDVAGKRQAHERIIEDARKLELEENERIEARSATALADAAASRTQREDSASPPAVPATGGSAGTRRKSTRESEVPLPAGGPVVLDLRFASALAFATETTRGRMRLGERVPQLSHLLAVASLVLDCGGGVDLAIGALLHDVGEESDQGPILERVDSQFGSDVARIVRETGFLRGLALVPSTDITDERIARLRQCDEGIVLISCADLLDDARAVKRLMANYGDDAAARMGAGPERVGDHFRRLSAVQEELMPESPLAGDLSSLAASL